MRRGRLSNLFFPKLRHFFFRSSKSRGVLTVSTISISGICPLVQVQLAYHSGAPSDNGPTKPSRMGNARRGAGWQCGPIQSLILCWGLGAGGAAVWYVLYWYTVTFRLSHWPLHGQTATPPSFDAYLIHPPVRRPFKFSFPPIPSSLPFRLFPHHVQKAPGPAHPPIPPPALPVF